MLNCRLMVKKRRQNLETLTQDLPSLEQSILWGTSMIMKSDNEGNTFEWINLHCFKNDCSIYVYTFLPCNKI